MNNSWKSLAAIGCCILYILLYLFLPVIAVKLIGIGASGINLFSVSVWSYLPLIAGIGMAICSILTPPKVGGIVCSIGTFIPLIAYFIINGEIVSGAASLISIPGMDSVIGMGANAIFTVGAGVVLPMLLGICAAVFCFLGGMQPKATERTAGFSAGSDDEW